MKSTREKSLAMIVVVTIAVAFVGFDPIGVITPLKASEVIGCAGQTVHLDGKEGELLRLHNEERAEHGVGALCADPRLAEAAKGHAEDMLRRGFYEHETPEGLSPGDRISRAGYPFATYGENNNMVSGMGVSEPGRKELGDAVESWMGSPGHRKTLLDPALREVGFGVTTGQYGSEIGMTTMYVADFGTRR